MNETLRNVDGRWVLHIERPLSQPVDKVWRALTEPAHLRQWFPAEVQVEELRVGAKITFVYDGEDPNDDGVVTQCEPPRVFAYTWDDDLLRWEVRPEGDGCVLLLDHIFDDRAGAASFATGWQGCIDALEAVAAGRPVEEVDGRRPAMHDAYVEQLGLADGSVEDTPDGWRVRFERQMTAPAEDVWAALTAEPPDGAVTAREEPTLLEYEWHTQGQPGGRVRCELGQGTGHGARLVVTQTGPAGLPDARAAALATWRARTDRLAAQMRAAQGG